MGFRLPLDSLPWLAAGDLPIEFPLDPSVERSPLSTEFVFPLGPRRRTSVPESDPRRGGKGSVMRAPRTAPVRISPAGKARTLASFARPGFQTSARGLVRTALCVEPRGGQLKVFLPPIQQLEPWVELVAAIERTAREMSLPVQLEGYAPPRDARLREFRLTPDPGVIEVNVPPTTSWREAVKQSEELYDATRRERLIAEKFEIDGAHVGSGGGNHVVLGGLTPDKSPFLRRPDVLGSFLRFWHNHPALSFLFSGRFIGPTSQAPRVDEARDDSAYELELALAQLPRAGESDAALGRRSHPAQHPGRHDRQHPSLRVLHRQALSRPTVRPGAWGCSSCGPSRCRPTSG